MSTYEQASAAQKEAEGRAERQLGMPVGSGLTPVPGGWAIKLYVNSRLRRRAEAAGLTEPVAGVPIVVDEIGPVRLHGG